MEGDAGRGAVVRTLPKGAHVTYQDDMRAFREAWADLGHAIFTALPRWLRWLWGERES